MGTEIAPFGCAILGAGEIADYGRVAGLTAPGAFVVCADGGFSHCQALGLRPGLLVGDFDSLEAAPPEDIPRVTLTPEKDYTDSYLAARQAVGRGYARLLLSGMLGGRLDHTLANIQLLAGLAREGADVMLTDGVTDGFALAGGGRLLLPHREDCYFSLFALEACRGLAIVGGRYPLKGFLLQPDDPRAVSNEFVGGDAVITQESGLLVVICCPK